MVNDKIPCTFQTKFPCDIIVCSRLRKEGIVTIQTEKRCSVIVFKTSVAKSSFEKPSIEKPSVAKSSFVKSKCMTPYIV